MGTSALLIGAGIYILIYLVPIPSPIDPSGKVDKRILPSTLHVSKHPLVPAPVSPKSFAVPPPLSLSLEKEKQRIKEKKRKLEKEEKEEKKRKKEERERAARQQKEERRLRKLKQLEEEAERQAEKEKEVPLPEKKPEVEKEKSDTDKIMDDINKRRVERGLEPFEKDEELAQRGHRRLKRLAEEGGPLPQDHYIGGEHPQSFAAREALAKGHSPKNVTQEWIESDDHIDILLDRVAKRAAVVRNGNYTALLTR